MFVNSSPLKGHSTKGNVDFVNESGRRGLEFYGKPNLKGILKNEVELCPNKVLLVGKDQYSIRKILVKRLLSKV